MTTRIKRIPSRQARDEYDGFMEGRGRVDEYVLWEWRWRCCEIRADMEHDGLGKSKKDLRDMLRKVVTICMECVGQEGAAGCDGLQQRE